MSMLIDAYRFGGGGGSDFWSILAGHGALLIAKHGEPTPVSFPVTAINEVGDDGQYTGSVTSDLGLSPIFPAGVGAFNRDTSSPTECTFPASVAPAGSLSEMTLISFFKPTALASYTHLISRDNDVGGRLWQWRLLNTGNIEFIKIDIAGSSIQTLSGTGAASNGVTTMHTATVSSANTRARIYANKTLLNSNTSWAAYDYGHASEPIRVGRRANDSASNGQFGASIIIPSELSQAQIDEIYDASQVSP